MVLLIIKKKKNNNGSVIPTNVNESIGGNLGYVACGGTALLTYLHELFQDGILHLKLSFRSWVILFQSLDNVYAGLI